MLHFLLAVLCVCSTHLCSLARTPAIMSAAEKTDRATMQQQVSNLIAHDYGEILAAYDKLKNVQPAEHNYYVHQLSYTIVSQVNNNTLRLYGNWCSRLWNSCKEWCQPMTPLIKFEKILVPDALGHIQKYAYSPSHGLEPLAQQLVDKLKDLQTIIQVENPVQVALSRFYIPLRFSA